MKTPKRDPVPDKQGPAQQDGDDHPDEGAPDQDPFLERLVLLANAKILDGWGVTLTIGGTTVSGRIASIADYYDNFADEIEPTFSFGPEITETMAKQYRDAVVGPYREAAHEMRERWESDEPPRDERPHHIHLKDALILTPGHPAMPSNRRIWWRGRIGQVDGFILGKMDPTDS